MLTWYDACCTLSWVLWTLQCSRFFGNLNKTPSGLKKNGSHDTSSAEKPSGLPGWRPLSDSDQIREWWQTLSVSIRHWFSSTQIQCTYMGKIPISIGAKQLLQDTLHHWYGTVCYRKKIILPSRFSLMFFLYRLFAIVTLQFLHLWNQLWIPMTFALPWYWIKSKPTIRWTLPQGWHCLCPTSM